MSITLNQIQVNQYLEAVLNAFKDGQLDDRKARNELAQALTMAAIDNEVDLSPYMMVESLQKRWGIARASGPKGAHTAGS
jgi:hypothetical protein